MTESLYKVGKAPSWGFCLEPMPFVTLLGKMVLAVIIRDLEMKLF